MEELQDQPGDILKATSADACKSNNEDPNRFAHQLDIVEQVLKDINGFEELKHEE